MRKPFNFANNFVAIHEARILISTNLIFFLNSIFSFDWHSSRNLYIPTIAIITSNHMHCQRYPFFGDIVCHLELVCYTVFQQYDNLYGFRRVFNVLSDSLPWVLLSIAFSSVSLYPSSFLSFCLSFPLLSLSFSFALYFFFSPRLSPPRFHAADRSAGHQRGFIPHSGTGVISHGWIGNPLSFYSPAPPRTYHPSPECCSTPSPQCLFAHSMGDYAVSEFTHSRKVRASRDILRVIAPC